MSFRKISLGAVYIIGGGDVANPAEKGRRGSILGNGENQKCSSESGRGRGRGALGVCRSAFLGTTSTLPEQLPQLTFLPAGAENSEWPPFLPTLGSYCCITNHSKT